MVFPADAWSWARVLLGMLLYLPAWYQQRTAFVALFILAGLTDVIDGMIARAKGTTQLGAVLDGLADRFIFVSGIIWAWWLAPAVLLQIWPVVVLMIFLDVLSKTYVFFKFRQLGGYHLMSGKMTALLLYLFLIVAVLEGFVLWLWSVLVACAIIMFVEELILTTRLKKFTPDMKSAFV